jgi:hypothetical protein
MMPAMIAGSDPAGHGAALVERVIAVLRADPRRPADDDSLLGEPLLTGPPQPMPAQVLAALRLPSGRTLPPSVHRWLEFDTAMLARSGWLASSRALRLTPRGLDEIATAEWGDDWGAYFLPLAGRFGECFLLPGGADSRRVLATGPADELGEYPVLAIDIDDEPSVTLMYPGFDVYLAHALGVVRHEHRHYASLIDDPAYAPRMRQHARHWLGGRVSAGYPFRW